MKCNIKCNTWDEKTNERSWEVTPEGRVWPCCFFSNRWDRSQQEPENSNKPTSLKILTEDPRFVKQIKKDPDFNNLKKYNFDEIVDSDFYKNDIWHPGWNSDNPPHICARECTVNPETNETRASLAVKTKVKR